jgi:tetratricopeptide (TPR) repeat protein
MFALEWQLVGRSPWLGHLVNILLYGFTGVLLFMILMWIGKNSGLNGRELFFALAGTILFVAHPLHTEAVANIKGRDELMSFLLSMLALWILLKSQPVVRPRAMLLSAICLFGALLAKENAITFLFIVPLTLVFFAKQSWLQAVKQTLPLVGATVAFLLIRGAVIGWSFGDAPRELMNNPFLKIVGNQYVDFSTGERFATILFTLGKYVQLLFFPHPLTHDYYPRHIEVMHMGDWQSLMSLLVYMGLIVLAIIGLRKKQVWGYGIIFYLATLSIVSNIVFPIGTNMSERFMYMPSLGWSIAIAALLVLLYERRQQVGWVVLGFITVLFAIKTVTRNPVWKDNFTLFTTDINTSKNSAKLRVATGGELTTIYGTKPQSPERDARLREAVEHLRAAQRIHPNYKLAYLLEGNANYFLKDWDASISAYQRVLTIDPIDKDASKNIAIAYRDAGRYFGEQQKDLSKAIRYLNEASKLLPDDYETIHALGVSYGLGGDAMRALQYFQKGVEIQPENATAHFNLGLAYQRVGDTANAQKHHDRALELDPQILERRKSGGQ